MPDAVMGERGGRGSGGLWTRLLRGVVLPAGDRAFGQRMMERLRFLEEAQWWDPERIEAERRRSLASLLDVGQAIEGREGRQTADQGGLRLRRHLAALDQPVQRLGDAGDGRLGGAFAHVVQPHRMAGGGRHLGDARAHGACAYDEDRRALLDPHQRPPNLGGRFSRKAATPSR